MNLILTRTPETFENDGVAIEVIERGEQIFIGSLLLNNLPESSPVGERLSRLVRGGDYFLVPPEIILQITAHPELLQKEHIRISL